MSADWHSGMIAILPHSACDTHGPSHAQGVISAGTLHRVANLRAQGVKFVVITGARLSTLLMRLPFLPFCDALVCESGGLSGKDKDICENGIYKGL